MSGGDDCRMAVVTHSGPRLSLSKDPVCVGRDLGGVSLSA